MKEENVKTKMQEVLSMVVADISSIRTGRANSSLVEDIVVPAYGGTQSLKVQELASISVQDAQTIVINPWDKSIIGDINKGIQAANIGINPSIDGEIIRITISPMTREDRERLVKLLGSKIESGKVMLRQVRGEFMKDIKVSFDKKEITEDEKFRQEKTLQDITDEFVGKIETLGENKKEELLQV